MPSPRAKTLAHLQVLIAAATATAAATSTGCGKKKAERPEDPYGSSGYAVVDPLPPPTIEKPGVPPSTLYSGALKVTVSNQKGHSVYRLTVADGWDDVAFDDVESPAVTADQKKLKAKSKELIVTVNRGTPIVVRAHGEAGTFSVSVEADDAGTNVYVTLGR